MKSKSHLNKNNDPGLSFITLNPNNLEEIELKTRKTKLNCTLQEDLDLEQDLATKSKPFLRTFIDYCEKTSIHGVQYVGDFKQNTLERGLWTFILLLAIFSSIILIGKTYEKWCQTPVIVGLDSKSTPVWKIPFPAITICPNKQFSKSDFDFVSAILKLDEDADIPLKLRTHMETIGQACNHMELLTSYKQEYFKLKGFNDTIKTSYFMNEYHSLYKNRYNKTEIGDSVCKWRDEKYSDKCFGRIITEEGICQTFNLLSPNEILREDVHHHEQLFYWANYKSNWDSKPKHAIGAGMKNGLEIFFADFKNDDYDVTCKGPIQGFKIVLHTPYELGDISNQFVHVTLGQQVLISIKPKIILASKKLTRYTPERRNCYFKDERYLTFFKFYNQKNCQIECLTNYTLNKCGCVKFFMPRNITTPICGLPKLRCCEDAERELSKIKYHDADNDEKDVCDCLPNCKSISYDTEMNVADYDYHQFYMQIIRKLHYNDSKSEKLLIEYKDLSATRLYIYFKEDQFLTSKRSELFGSTDFIAQCGGLLGLFMGFSVISLIEIIYFFTIRFLANIKLYVRNSEKYNS